MILEINKQQQGIMKILSNNGKLHSLHLELDKEFTSIFNNEKRIKNLSKDAKKGEASKDNYD